MLENFIGVSNHKMAIKINDTIYDINTFKNAPEVQYTNPPVLGEPGVMDSIVIGIKDMPGRIKNTKYIVSRETLHAVGVLSKAIINDPVLKRFMKDNQLKHQRGLEIRIRYIGYTNLEKEYPEFFELLSKNFKDPRETYKGLKKFLNRDDLYRPGPKYRDPVTNEVVACEGLIRNTIEG